MTACLPGSFGYIAQRLREGSALGGCGERSQSAKGKHFERVCKFYLENEPEYAARLKRVWLWEDWPGRKHNDDRGVDLVAQATDGGLWAIQAKFYQGESLSKARIDSFVACAGGKQFSHRLLLSTTEGLGKKARETLAAQADPGSWSWKLLGDLESATLVWPTELKRLRKRTRPLQPKPFAYQKQAVDDVCEGFASERRGQLLMACGSGKTLTTLWCAEALRARRVLVVVPSLSLLAQTLQAWRLGAREAFDACVVCSDQSAAGDAPAEHAGELGVPVTVAPELIRGFLRRRGSRPLVVLSTYQSLEKVQQAQAAPRVPLFDLAIVDEAHRTTGAVGGMFSMILEEGAVRARRRLFATATPRIATQAAQSRSQSEGLELASMDDASVYGSVFHHFGFAQAIEEKRLSDYRVVVIGVESSELAGYAQARRFVTRGGALCEGALFKGALREEPEDAGTLATMVVTAKAMRKYRLLRVLSFHSFVKRARHFSERFAQVVEWMPKATRPGGPVWAGYAHGDMPTRTRRQLVAQLTELEGYRRGLLSNAKCLTEGVDIPALDGVVFADPMRSTVGIVQAVGRALRLAEGKDKGTIVVPVYLEKGQDASAALESSAFLPVWEVLRALRSHDERLAAELDRLRLQLGRHGTVSKMPQRVQVDFPSFHVGPEFSNAFRAHLVRSSTRRQFRSFEEAREFARGLGLTGKKEWVAYAKGALEQTHGLKPEDIPANPKRVYQDNGWAGFGDWLGTGNVATQDRQFRSFEEAREFVRGLKLDSVKQWLAYAKGDLEQTHGLKPEDIPTNPNVVYGGEGWAGYGDWLGTGKVATFERKYRSFADAREFVRGLGLTGKKEWRAYCKGALENTHGLKPEDIPADPADVYRDTGWVSWGDWLGTSTVANQDRQFRSFEKAREFVRGLRLTGRKQWFAYCKGALEQTHGLKPEDIPATPQQVYRDKGWAGFGDWLGTGNVATFERKYRSFRKARAFVRGLQLANREQWAAYAKGALEKTHGLRPEDIPANPHRFYRGKGWEGMGDWLGTGKLAPKDREFRSFPNAREFVRGLGLTGRGQWRAYCKGVMEQTHGLKPEDIPATPEKVYRGKGWEGWGDWLGTSTVANQDRQFRSFEKAREFVRGLRLTGRKQWFAYCKGALEQTHGLKPEDIPATPQQVYQHKGWVSWGDWLGTGNVRGGPTKRR